MHVCVVDLVWTCSFCQKLQDRTSIDFFLTYVESLDFGFWLKSNPYAIFWMLCVFVFDSLGPSLQFPTGSCRTSCNGHAWFGAIRVFRFYGTKCWCDSLCRANQTPKIRFSTCSNERASSGILLSPISDAMGDVVELAGRCHSLDEPSDHHGLQCMAIFSSPITHFRICWGDPGVDVHVDLQRRRPISGSYSFGYI